MKHHVVWYMGTNIFKGAATFILQRDSRFLSKYETCLPHWMWSRPRSQSVIMMCTTVTTTVLTNRIKSIWCLYRTCYSSSICVCYFTCITVTSVSTEPVSQCQVMQKVCGTALTWVQHILYLFQLRFITFWIMVWNCLPISMPGLNGTWRYEEC